MEKQVVLDKQKQKLTPDLEGTMPEEPLFEYFLTKLPEDLSVEEYNKILSCQGFAKLMILDLGGPEKAKAYWVPEESNPSSVDNERTGHTYVVQIGSDPLSRAFNNKRGENRNVAYVLEHGVENTGQLFSMLWNQL